MNITYQFDYKNKFSKCGRKHAGKVCQIDNLVCQNDKRGHPVFSATLRRTEVKAVMLNICWCDSNSDLNPCSSLPAPAPEPSPMFFRLSSLPNPPERVFSASHGRPGVARGGWIGSQRVVGGQRTALRLPPLWNPRSPVALSTAGSRSWTSCRPQAALHMNEHRYRMTRTGAKVQNQPAGMGHKLRRPIHHLLQHHPQPAAPGRMFHRRNLAGQPQLPDEPSKWRPIAW